MKKLCLCFSLFLLIGCNYKRDVSYIFKKGDIKLTITKDYIIVDTFELDDVATWNFYKTINRSDSAACNELLEKILTR